MKALIAILVILLLGKTSAASSTLILHKRDWIINSFSIVEEHPGPFPYVLGTIDLKKNYKVNFELTGSGVDQEPKGLLHIDHDTGVITVNGKVDYEQYKILKLKFEARKTSNMALHTRLAVEINILDINDNPPRFHQEVYEITVMESEHQGASIMTVLAVDFDEAGSPNSIIDYAIISVTPMTQNIQFYIEENGRISFKGCLDYEKAQRYTIKVEAKDRGEVVRLSSTCNVIVNVEDKNNHLPTVIGHTGTGRVKEMTAGQTILRVQVNDKDTKNTAAWRAKYTLLGDIGNNFHIETDLETNDGILSVVKALDFEEGSLRNLSIRVENEAPYFSCEVKERLIQGFWKVHYTDSSSGQRAMIKAQEEKISVIVEDVNNPPEFLSLHKRVMVHENTEIGHLLETFTAVDKDKKFSHGFVYMKGEDPEGWVSVDLKTGKITTVKTLDRESKHVVNNTYTITLYAIDKGEPPMTGTATFSIHLMDQNDNTPQLFVNKLEMCLSDGASMANITAYDRDEDPYAGPFHFELLGDVKGRWRLDSSFGTTVKLVKEATVYAGPHKVLLKISDRQGQSSQQNLSVMVCDCSVTPDCRSHRETTIKLGGRTIGIMFVSLLLLLGMLLLVMFVSCGKDKATFPDVFGYEHILISSNTESPGTDCEVPNFLPKNVISNGVISNTEISNAGANTSQQTKMTQEGCCVRSQSLKDNFLACEQRGGSVYHLRLCSLREQENDLINDSLHMYADEGTDEGNDTQLDAISISEVTFDPDDLLQLGPYFNNLAALCRPEPDQRFCNTIL